MRNWLNQIPPQLLTELTQAALLWALLLSAYHLFQG
jgi:hypothetical protein